MGRPKLSLKEWCNADQKLKLDFIEQESQRSGGLIQWNGNYYVPRVMASQRTTISAQLSNHKTIHLNSECFEKLKSRYRTIKKKQKDSGLIKKQYQFKPKTVDKIKKIQQNNSWSREEVVIENLINNYIGWAFIDEKRTQLETNKKYLKLLTTQIDEKQNEINDLNSKNNTLDKKIEQLIKKLAQISLLEGYYKDILLQQEISVAEPDIKEEILEEKIHQIKEQLKPKTFSLEDFN